MASIRANPTTEQDYGEMAERAIDDLVSLTVRSNRPVLD